MKSILEKSCRDQLIGRIHLLNEKSISQWGKMNVCQMVKHCTLWDEMIIKNKTYKRMFIGRIFGKMALKKILADDRFLSRNTPTIPAFVVKEPGSNLTGAKTNWIAMIEQYKDFTNESFIHPFFGRMSAIQIGIMAYKHTDHHLRQFNL